jgi:hypothetical protein
MLDYRALIVAASTLALGGCGTASSQIPDSSKPGHCVAAFHYGRELALAGPNAKMSLAIQSTARALFEGKRMQVNGTFATGERQGAALLKAHGHDSVVMMPLLLACAKKQDADPLYRSLNDSGQLMAAARKTDPACRSDMACSSATR